MKPIATIVLFDAGFKDSAPALLSLVNQTIIDKLQVIWVEYYDTIFSKVYDYDFVTKIKLNRPKNEPYDMAACYNAGLSIAEGKYYTLCGPCLWFRPYFFENLYKYHDSNEAFTFNREARITKKYPNIRFKLTDSYSDINDFKPEYDLKENNRGCMATFNTHYFNEVDGFDIIHSDTHLADRNALSICLLRINNLFESIPTKLTVKRLDELVYHPFHPRKGDRFSIDRTLIKQNRNRAKNNVSVIKPIQGLEYFKTKYNMEIIS